MKCPALSMTFEARIAPDVSWSRAELQLELTALRKFVLRVVINGEVELVVWDRPLVPHQGGEGRVLLCQRIPPEALRKGDNTIEVRAERILGDPSEVRSRVFGAVLALGGAP